MAKQYNNLPANFQFHSR